MARAVGRLRAALIAAVTEEDIRLIVKALIRKAKKGDIAAAREVLDRTLGRPIEPDLLERLESLEQALQAGSGTGRGGGRPGDNAYSRFIRCGH